MSPPNALQIGMASFEVHAGGLDRYYFELLRAFENDGISVRGLVTGNAAAPSGDPNVGIFADNRDLLLLKWLKMRRVAGPLIDSSDLVVSHFAPHTFPIVDRLKGKPLVVHFHGPWAAEGDVEGRAAYRTALKRRIERAVYGAAARVIVLSDAFGEIVERDYGVAPNNIRVIPGGVDVARFEPLASKTQMRERLGWPIDRPTVVSVRRLVQAKGLENLIRAAVLLRERIPNIFIAIGGTGPLAETLAASIVELGLQNTVRMLGRISEDDLPSVYGAADLFVVPTVALEGFGLVVVEALACGTPVLVTPVGGLPSVVRALEPGLILESAQPQHLANGIGAALAGTLPLPSAKRCVAYARNFSWSAISRLVSDVYREVAAPHALDAGDTNLRIKAPFELVR